MLECVFLFKAVHSLPEPGELVDDRLDAFSLTRHRRLTFDVFQPSPHVSQVVAKRGNFFLVVVRVRT